MEENSIIVKNIDHIIDVMSCLLKEELDKGAEDVCTEEYGEVADILKDMAQAKKYMYEAEYYKTVVEAMHNGDKESYMFNKDVVQLENANGGRH